MTKPQPQPNQKTWIFRVSNLRPIQVKGKSEQIRKIAAMDFATSLPIGLDVPKEVSMDALEVGQASMVRVKIYTSQEIDGVAPEYIEFFKQLDMDQPVENFIKTYWLYPKNIKFELVEIQPA